MTKDFISNPTPNAPLRDVTWRDDPLSVVLVLAVLLLGLMYIMDEIKESTLYDQQERAKNLRRGDLEACEVTSAGPSGSVLVVSCAQIDALAMVSRAQGVWNKQAMGFLDAFTQVAFRDAERTLLCDLPVKSWPNACVSTLIREKIFFEKAKRRRVKYNG